MKALGRRGMRRALPLGAVALVLTGLPAATVAPAARDVLAEPVAARDSPATPPAPRVLWVDPGKGRDSAPGTRQAPLRTVAEAWRRIPAATTLRQGVRIELLPGVYPQSHIPHYWEQRWGTGTTPIVIRATQGRGSVVFRGDVNAFQLRHVVFDGVSIVRSGDTFHCERCEYVTLRNMRLDGRGAAHETIKVNQSHHFDVVNSDVSGAYENAIDFVAVNYSTIKGNRIHHGGDWCAYVKGGSAGIVVRDNRIHDCGTGGFTAGQGTGVEYLVPPWFRYESYGVTVFDNVIHDTDGAGLGVNGGYNVVMAFNTLYRVGARSHLVEFVHGGRSCDGNTQRCAQLRRLGAWGGPGVDGQFVPNRHVFFMNNVILNPPGTRSRWQHLTVADNVIPPRGSGVPSPARADDDLRIFGNVIRNGALAMPSGLADDREFRLHNRVNTMPVALVDPEHGGFRPVPGSQLALLASVPIPRRTWHDAGVPPLVDVRMSTSRPPGARRP